MILLSELVRKQFYISKSHDALLKERAKELGTTEAELVREAIENQMGKIGFSKKHLNQWQEERKFIIELIGNGPIKGGRVWQRDDIYDV